MVVVDDLDERLDLGALLHLGLRHTAGNLLGVALNAGNESVGEAVGLGATVDRCDDDNPLRVLVFVPILNDSPSKLTSFRPACHGSIAHR